MQRGIAEITFLLCKNDGRLTMSMPLLWNRTLRNFLLAVCSSRFLEEEGGVLNLTRSLTNTTIRPGILSSDQAVHNSQRFIKLSPRQS